MSKLREVVLRAAIALVAIYVGQVANGCFVDRQYLRVSPFAPHLVLTTGGMALLIWPLGLPLFGLVVAYTATRVPKWTAVVLAAAWAFAAHQVLRFCQTP